MLKFIDQLEAVAANPTNPLYGKLDFNNMGAAGHSRGAKIAAMHFAGERYQKICDGFLAGPDQAGGHIRPTSYNVDLLFSG